MKSISIRRHVVCAGTVLTVYASASLGQITSSWLSPTSGNWSDATRWSTDPVFPNNSGNDLFNATINAIGSPYTVSLDVPIRIESLTLDSSDAILEFSGSNTLVAARASAIANSLVRGTGQAGALRFLGTLDLQGSRFDNMSEVFANAGATFSGSVSDDLNDTCVIHRGTGGWSGNGDINLRGMSGILIQPGSTFAISSNRAITWDNSGPMAMFSNAGTVTKTSTGTTSVTNVTLSNVGTLDIQGGTFSTNGVSLTAGNLATGTWRVSNGAALDLIGVSITTNSAEISIDGATSSFAALSTLSTNASTGKLTLSGGSTFTSAGDITNNGVLTVGTGSTFTVASGSTLTNFATGTISGGTFLISGTLKFDNSGVTTLDTSLTLSGAAATIQTGAGADALLSLSRITTNGTLALKDSKTFTTSGNFKVDGNNSGILDLEAGTAFTVPSGSTLDNYNSGTRTLSEGDFRVAGTLTFDNVGIERLDSKLTLDGPAAQVLDSSSANALSDLAFIDGFGALTLSNTANFTANASNVANYVFTVAPTGIVNVDSGSQLDINGDLANYAAGQFNTGEFNVEGTLRAQNITSIFTISTRVALASSTANITNFNNDDVFATVNLITASGDFRISNGKQQALTSGSGLSNQGSFTIGGLSAGDTSVVTLSQSYQQSGTASTTVQNGARLIIGGNYQMNSGTLHVRGSQVDVGGEFRQAGGLVNLAAGSRLVVDGSYTQNGGELFLAGGELVTAGGYNSPGGTLSGEGVINGDLVTGGMIDPGSQGGLAPGSAGRFLVTGDVLLNTGAVLHLDLGLPIIGGENGYDQLSITRALSIESAAIFELAFTLRPRPGDVYIPLVFGSRTGELPTILGLQIDSTLFAEPSWTPNGLRLLIVEIPTPGTLLPLLASVMLVTKRRRR